MNRDTLVLIVEEEFALTLMYPMSGEHDCKLIVLYEDAHGEVDMKIMTPKAIANNYSVSIDEINTFIEEVKDKKNEQ